MYRYRSNSSGRPRSGLETRHVEQRASETHDSAPKTCSLNRSQSTDMDS